LRRIWLNRFVSELVEFVGILDHRASPWSSS
jgi:hypothetical protein